MKIKYLIKQAKYYKRLDGSINRMAFKFLFSRKPLSKFTNGKLYNYIYQKRVNKFTKKFNPTILQIENTNMCNARCIMCPHPLMKRKQKIMSLENFKIILDGVIPKYKSIRVLNITGFGESLIDKSLIEKIKYANEKYPHLLIDIFTNASLLNEDVSEKLLNTEMHKINFSLNSIDKTYTKITGLDYEVVKKNVLYFLKRKKDLKKTYPLINISLMLLPENKKDVDKFIEFWSQYGDSVMTYLPLDWAGDKKIETVEKAPFKKKRWPCIPLWQNLTIDVEGNVIMCCQDYESRVKFGNVLDQPIESIVNGEKFEKIRELHKNNCYSMDVCNTCDNWINSSLWWWVYN